MVAVAVLCLVALVLASTPRKIGGRCVGGQLKKLERKRKRRRENAARQHSRKMANAAHTVVVEDLNIKAMTKSAKGTVENPGTNVKAKAGLNRGILASNWGRLERMLDYKAGQVVRVAPAYTSQTCARCGGHDPANRRTQSLFQCTNTRCGHTANADHNAAINILERGLALLPKARGMGPLHGERRSVPGRRHGRRPNRPLRAVNQACRVRRPGLRFRRCTLCNFL